MSLVKDLFFPLRHAFVDPFILETDPSVLGILLELFYCRSCPPSISSVPPFWNSYYLAVILSECLLNLISFSLCSIFWNISFFNNISWRYYLNLISENTMILKKKTFSFFALSLFSNLLFPTWFGCLLVSGFPQMCGDPWFSAHIHGWRTEQKP